MVCLIDSNMISKVFPRELRLFRATEIYDIKGRGIVYVGPCPFVWNKADGLAAWSGDWLISHPQADHTKVYTVIGVESFCLHTIREGSDVGILVKVSYSGE